MVVIRTSSHKGLEALYEEGSSRGVKRQHVDKLTRILSVLDHARSPQDIALPGFRAHPLRGARIGHWSIRVSGNWRVTLRVIDGDVFDVDYVGYH